MHEVGRQATGVVLLGSSPLLMQIGLNESTAGRFEVVHVPQDMGNSTIVAGYLHLLGSFGMVPGLQKYSPRLVRQRASSPKLQVWNTALLSAATSHTFQSAREDSVFWGHLCESAVGAHLMNSMHGTRMEVLYWSKGDPELDFVLVRDTAVIGIEVKSGPKSRAIGLEVFLQAEPKARGVIVGEGGALTAGVPESLRGRTLLGPTLRQAFQPLWRRRIWDMGLAHVDGNELMKSAAILPA